MASSTVNKEHTAVRGIGEIALRVSNLDVMQKFYEEILGLPLLARFSNSAFFKIADGYGGHAQVLALFDRSSDRNDRGPMGTSTLDHLAFEIALADYSKERTRLESLGLQVETAEHAWVHWRSLYITDPEGNQVELVCYDDGVR